MDNQEAIEVMFNEWKCIDRNDGIHCDRKCESCDLVMDVEIIREAFNKAIAALEKQIPKKVRVTTSTKRCSVCGRQLSGIGNIHPKRNYCQSCGQAIDWEGE